MGKSREVNGAEGAMAKRGDRNPPLLKMEREKGIEPSTTCLEGRRSTTELLPLGQGLWYPTTWIFRE